MSFKSFADDSATVSIGGITIENGTDRLKVYGEQDVTRDKAGLAMAQKMKEVWDSAVAALQSDPALPNAVAPIEAPTTVTNPFAHRS